MDAAADLNRPWPAPAKLNRFLHITGRRDDGYHLLQTAFQFLERGDRLWFAPNDSGRIERAGAVPGVDADDDLCLRAARLLAAEAGHGRCGATVRLEKTLPVGGGLGGGSSDAATTLVALNHYWRLGLDVDQLATLGLTLGADVPVFVRGQAAWAEGVGERLTPLLLDRPWFVVLVPPVSVATTAVFADPALPRATPPLPTPASGAAPDTAGLGNDCEAVVFRRYPAIAAAARWLGGFARPRLTGTGCCVFAAFPDRAAAEAVLEKRAEWSRVARQAFCAQGTNRSVLQDRLQTATIAPVRQTTGP